MKKILTLFAAVLMACSINAQTTTDGQTYEPTDGLKCVNLWALDHKHNKTEYDNLKIGDWSLARTACVHIDENGNGAVYVADNSNNDPEVVDGEGTMLYSSRLHKFDLATGEYLGILRLLEDDGKTPLATEGTGYKAWTIGVDSYNHVYVMSLSTSQTTTIKLRSVDTTTGVTEVVAELEKEADGRSDFGDVAGDITRENDKCVVCFAHSSGPGAWIWECAKGEEEWLGGFEGEINYWEFENFCPATAGNFGISPAVKNVPDEEGNYGKYFLLDGHGTKPALYDNTGELVEGCNFNSVDESMQPEQSANGVTVFKINDKNYLAYASTIWLSESAYQVNVAQIGDDYKFNDMKLMWSLPKDGLSASKDNGGVKNTLFIESISHCYAKDKEDREGVYLLIYEPKVGLASYFIGDKDYEMSPTTGITTVVANNAKIFNSKYVEKSRLVIVKNGKKYNVSGIQVK